MAHTKRSQQSQRKQTRKNAHKRMPENFHRFIWNGTRFASKLEISWAFFLDGLRIQWEYETKPVFLFKGTPDVIGYTPDFWLPKMGVFLEIKGRVLLPQAVERMEYTAHETGCPVILAQGSPSRALNHYVPDTGLLVKTPNLNSDWQEVELAFCPECRVAQFHQLNNREGVIGTRFCCNHHRPELSRSIVQSIAGKRIPDSAIHLLSRKVNEL
jgi:hypothetical protein